MKKFIPMLLIAIVFLSLIGAVVYTKVVNVEQIPDTTSVTPTPTQAMQKSLENEIILTVTTPEDGTTVSTPNVMVKGKTVASAEVFVNDTKVLADARGNFSANVTLDEGENVITVTANDTEGNAAESELTLTYTPAE